eukprot:maker-scaffold1109_size62184-snap-gene-0.11 protein:Tk00665 transcript:maker-scaffold1109_size62184-snap-gene-0.11-mRNA-1 annotation:"hormone receptor-like in 96"
MVKHGEGHGSGSDGHGRGGSKGHGRMSSILGSDELPQNILKSEEPRQAVRVCPVCGQETKYNQLKNYGAYSCFSCRAFFRRSHENCKTPDFVCRKSGNCDIHLSKRKKCRKCRYDRCVELGMRQDRILDESAKQKRFKNFGNWRKRKPHGKDDVGGDVGGDFGPMKQFHDESQSPTHPPWVGWPLSQDHVYDIMPTSSQLSRPADPYINVQCTTELRIDECAVMHFSRQESNGSTRSSETGSPDALTIDESGGAKASDPGPNLRIRTDLISPLPPDERAARRQKIQLIDDEYQRAMFNMDMYRMLLDQVRSVDGSPKLAVLNQSMYLQTVKILKTQFFKFSFSLPTFMKLDKPDQVTLLNDNAVLFIQLLMAKAFTADDGLQQLSYLVGFLTEDTETRCHLQKVSFQDFCHMTNLFQGDIQRELEYLKLIPKLRRLRLYGESLSVMAYLITFHVLPSDEFSNENLVLKGVQDVVELIQEKDPDTAPDDILNFFGILLDMRRLFSTELH